MGPRAELYNALTPANPFEINTRPLRVIILLYEVGANDVLGTHINNWGLFRHLRPFSLLQCSPRHLGSTRFTAVTLPAAVVMGATYTPQAYM